jgi:hypothetical protein
LAVSVAPAVFTESRYRIAVQTRRL